MSNWQRIKEEGEKFHPFVPRSRESVDKEIVVATELCHDENGDVERDGKGRIYRNRAWKSELYIACKDMLFWEEVKWNVRELRRMYPDKDPEQLKLLVMDHLRKEGYPKEWRIRKRITEERKKIRKMRGY
jgi:hypothetical protein